MFKILTLLFAIIQATLTKLHGHLLIEIFRHGARSPLQNVLKVPYYKQYGPGVLFENGMRQHFMLGKQITTQFNNTLKATFGSTQQLRYAKVYASPVARCIASAQSHLLGIFPQGTGMKVTSTESDVLIPPYNGMTATWDGGDEALENQFMPVVTEVQKDMKMDTFFNPSLGMSCPKGHADITSMTKSYKSKIENEIQPFIDQINDELKAQNYSSMKVFKKDKYDWDSLYKFFDAM